MKSKNELVLLSKKVNYTRSAVVSSVIMIIAVFAIGILCNLGCKTQSGARSYYQSKQHAKHASTCDMAELQEEISHRDQAIQKHNDTIRQIYQKASDRAKERGVDGYAFTVSERRTLRENRENIEVLEAEKNAYATELSNRAGAGGCFTADTKILMEKGYKKISEIKVGDKVLTIDPEGNLASNKVVKTFTFTNNHYFLINKNIRVTALHRFYTDEGWKKTIDLRIGDRIQLASGAFEPIASKDVFSEDLTVHNLHIADNHNFFVSSDGENGYMVHNCGGGGGK